MMSIIKAILPAFLLPFILASNLFADNTDWSKPSVSDTYSAWPGYVKDLARSAAMMDYTGDSSIPTGVIRYNTTTNQLERYNGSSFDAQLITNIKDGAVSTTAKMGTGVVTSTNILDATIANGDIANTTIQGGKIASGTITGTNIASATIDNSKLSITPSSCSCSLTGQDGMVISSVVTDACKYQVVGGIASFTMKCTFTAATAPSPSVGFTLPITPQNAHYSLFCRTHSNGQVGAGVYSSSGFENAIALFTANITTGASRVLSCSGVFEYTSP